MPRRLAADHSRVQLESGMNQEASRMLKRGIGIAVVVAAGACALAVPTGAKEHGGDGGAARHLAAATCKQERADLGRDAFAEKYGKHAMKACLKATATEAHNAAQECRAERDELGADAFRDKYGTNHNHRNAFGKCVSQHVNADDEEASCDQAGD